VTTAPPSGQPIPAPPTVGAAPADAIVTPSGLASKVLRAGTGERHPTAMDKVKVNYTGWTTDGKMFDSSVTRGQAITFPLSGVIKGWTEGVQLMKVGEQRRFWIPKELAYGDSPNGPKGMLVFDVELIAIVDTKAAPPPPPPVPTVAPIPAPPDVAVPPAGAPMEKSGLASKVLAKGTGTKHPGPKSKVKVHYTGWTTDGKMFDSSVQRGEPATFGLDQVIAGWTEGLQLMVEGEKRRLWIPEKLAYKGQPGRPAGMLVFDVELIQIVAP
jgi:peptidylprolyl isomerase